jgi:serine/threonine-protein kinase
MLVWQIRTMPESSRSRNRARAHTRYPVIVRVTRYGDAHDEWCTVNLSEGGMYVEAVAPLVPGSLVQVGIHVDDVPEDLVCTAQVMWRNDPDDLGFAPDIPAGMGMKFLDLPPAAEGVLRRFLAELENPEDIAIAEVTLRRDSGNREPSSAPGANSTTELQSLLLATGTVLGSYRILGVLGQGGMGTVYLAEHIRLGREVAIKRLHPKFTHDATAAQRFFDEARLVNQIRHAHITEITDFITEGTDHYFVMELLDGTSLAEVLARHGQLPLARAVHIGLQLCDVLDAVHAQGIVHRDLKPENILLVRRGEDPDFVKLVDFGIAKLRESAGSSKRSTTVGLVIGTPGYIAPEIVLGDALDNRIDVYSFGVVFYQMVVGELPFQANGFDQLIVKQATELPPSPKEMLTLPVPPEVEHLIIGCLDAEPSNRPESMAEIADVLRGVDEALWATDDPPSPEETEAVPPAPPSRRWLAYVVAVLLIAGGIAVFLELRGRRFASDPGRTHTPDAMAIPEAQSDPKPSSVVEDPHSEPEREQADAVKPEDATPARTADKKIKQSKRKSQKKRRSRKTAESDSADSGPYQRGLELLRERKALLAITELEKAVTAAPKHAEAHRALGKANLLVGRNAAAVSSFERYLQLRPNAKDAAKMQAFISAHRSGR